MSMPTGSSGTEADQVLSLYFEADRTTIRHRYEQHFWKRTTDATPDELPAAQHAVEQDSNDEFSNSAASSEAISELDEEENEQINNVDEAFFELILSLEPSERVVDQIAQRWIRFHDDTKNICLHYLACVFDDNITFDHGNEGLVHFFGAQTATPLLHAAFPADAFPLDGEMSFARFQAILARLGIDIQVDKDFTEFQSWLNISDSVLQWGEDKGFAPWQTWAAVYDLGPRLLPTPPPYSTARVPKGWVIATNNQLGEFDEVDSHGEENVGTWAINKNAKRGDLALMYCVSPRSAIVGIYRVLEDAHYDPFGGWNGFRAEVGERVAIPWIHISDMKKDPNFAEWKLVRGNFQGLLHYELPENIWAHIKHVTKQADPSVGERLEALGNAAFGVREIRVTGEGWSEKDVEDQLVIPLLEKCGWKCERTLVRQVEMLIKVGSGRPQKVRADFVGYRQEMTSEPLMVVEVKKGIASTKDLEFAVQQAESYAGRLRCPRFAIAAPEGIWVYKLEFPGISSQLASFELSGIPVNELVEKIVGIIGFDACSKSPVVQ